MNQGQFIQKFNSNPKHVLQINPELFKRDENEIIENIKLLYLSIQKTMGVDSYFTLHIRNFTVIEDYDSVRSILAKYQEAAIKKSVKLRGNTENRFNFIDLKESDVKILIIEMYLEAYDTHEIVETVLAVPRVVNGQYVNLNGNERQMMFQMVDASTYNNQTSNSKNPMVVFKTNFQPIKIYRNIYTLHTITNEDIDCVHFDCDTFSKSLPACEYIFAKMGLTRGLQFLGLGGQIWIHPTLPPYPEDHYIFQPNKLSEATQYYIAVPRSLFNGNYVLQHVVNTILNESNRKFMTYEQINSNDTWLEALGRHYSLATPRTKAISVLSSFEMIYDRITKDISRMDPNDMTDIYAVLRWCMYEFNALILKSNLDIYQKRFRVGEYAAFLIAPKLFKAMCTLGDMGDRVNTISIKKRIMIPFDYLLTELGKESIVVFNDTVTDCDSFNAIRYSKNGPSAISDSNGNAAMPVIYRYLHPTSLGVSCLNTSSPSNPGTSSVLVPFITLSHGGYVDPNYHEPNGWRDRVINNINEYKKETKLKQIVERVNPILDDSNVPEMKINDFKISDEDRKRLLLTANR